jgi:hypothetical protein
LLFRSPAHSLIVEDLSVTPPCESRWEVGHGFFKSNNSGHQLDSIRASRHLSIICHRRLLNHDSDLLQHLSTLWGGIFGPTGSSLLAYTRAASLCLQAELVVACPHTGCCIFVPTGSSLRAHIRGCFVCGLIVACLTQAASLCLRAHRCANTDADFSIVALPMDKPASRA